MLITDNIFSFFNYISHIYQKSLADSVFRRFFFILYFINSVFFFNIFFNILCRRVISQNWFLYYFSCLQKLLHFKHLPCTKIYLLYEIIGTEKIFKANRSMKMMQSKVYRGNRYISFVRCISDLLRTNSIDWAHLEWCALDERWREPHSSARQRIERTRKRKDGGGRRRLRDRCARLRPAGLVGRSIKRESVVRESFCCYRGLEPGRWLFTRDRLLLPVRWYRRSPCYQIMSLLFKNHAAELGTCALSPQSITIM